MLLSLLSDSNYTFFNFFYKHSYIFLIKITFSNNSQKVYNIELPNFINAIFNAVFFIGTACVFLKIMYMLIRINLVFNENKHMI